MSAPTWSPIDDQTADLLALVADPTHPVGRDASALFLAACRRDAMAHDGIVSVNRVRAILSGEDINPRRYSALWAQFTGTDKPMVKAGAWEVCAGSGSGNDGRPFMLRRWVGELR